MGIHKKCIHLLLKIPSKWPEKTRHNLLQKRMKTISISDLCSFDLLAVVISRPLHG
jgi:hypothetical protein